ncbi:unnamed protein product [Diplocarpon coronariae]
MAHRPCVGARRSSAIQRARNNSSPREGLVRAAVQDPKARGYAFFASGKPTHRKREEASADVGSIASPHCDEAVQAGKSSAAAYPSEVDWLKASARGRDGRFAMRCDAREIRHTEMQEEPRRVRRLGPRLPSGLGGEERSLRTRRTTTVKNNGCVSGAVFGFGELEREESRRKWRGLPATRPLAHRPEKT